MHTKLSFGEWFVIVVCFIFLIYVLLQIGKMGEASQILYYKAISGDFFEWKKMVN